MKRFETENPDILLLDVMMPIKDGCLSSHISQVLSARLSSRPLGWSLIGTDQMARLRVYNENGGNIYNH